MNDKERSKGWGTGLLVVGGLGLCCGAHVMATIGGLAAAAGLLAEWGWLLVVGLVAIAGALWLMRSHRGPRRTQAKARG